MAKIDVNKRYETGSGYDKDNDTSLFAVANIVRYLFFCLYNATASTEIYTLHIVGSVRCV